MQQETAPFFSPLPRRMEIPDEDYAQAQVCVAMADALSRTTNHSIYLIDYNRRNFLYVSSNSLFLCGRTPEEVQRLDYSFYLEVVPPEEIQTLQAINEAGFRFYYAQPLEKRMDFIIEYDFHIRASDRHTHLVHHKLTPVLLSPQGDCASSPWRPHRRQATSSSQTGPTATATSIPLPDAVGTNCPR